MIQTFTSSPDELGISDAVMTVIEGIEADIIRSRILPGMRLIEDHLMEDYNAKRHAVRAALVELQRLGVVVKPRHLGAELRRFDLVELTYLYRMRDVLHSAAVRMIPFPLGENHLARLERALQEHSDAAVSEDIIQIHRKNMVFHRVLFGLCGNPYLDESIRLHDWLSFPVRAYGVADANALSTACDEHSAMVAAVRIGDVDTLERLVVAHTQVARGIYEKKFLNSTRDRAGANGPDRSKGPL